MSAQLLHYSPIKYKIQKTWGAGDNILSRLSQSQAHTWNHALPHQDKRSDPGQGELVTYFALALTELLELSPSDADVVIQAAILHDVGYDFIAGINETFLRFEKAYWTGEFSKSKELQEENRIIRIEHQNNSVEFAKKILSDHPRLEEICKIIGDHDTRLEAPTALGQLMWDADILWRTTFPCLEVSLRRIGTIELEEIIKTREAQIKLSHKQLHLKISQSIGRIELANTVMHLLHSRNEIIPEHFQENYAKEIDIIAKHNP